MSKGSNQIETVGELRKFLVDMMVGVKNGDLDLDKASRLTKLAAQVNESFYSEIKVMKVRAELTQEALIPLGKLPINQTVA